VTTVSGDAPAPKPAAKPKAPARPAQNNHRG